MTDEVSHGLENRNPAQGFSLLPFTRPAGRGEQNRVRALSLRDGLRLGC